MDVIVMIFFAGIFSGFVDAIAGGGGLVMIPALLLTGLPVDAGIATNKLCGTVGTLTSSLTFARSAHVEWRACLLMGVPAMGGSVLGSLSIGLVPVRIAEVFVVILLVVIALIVVFAPRFRGDSPPSGGVSERTHETMGRKIQSGLWGFLIGFHDGFFGPGTGTFLVFALMSLWSLDFLRGTGSAKVINFLTNVTALASFVIAGSVHFSLGLVGALGVGLGSYGGAAVARTGGARVIRPLLILVTLAIIGRLVVTLWSR